MKIDLKKSGGDFSSVNTFLPKLKSRVLDLSVLFFLMSCMVPEYPMKWEESLLIFWAAA
jgi:hypothetical protein